MLSSGLAGLAGGLFAYMVSYIDPKMFGVLHRSAHALDEGRVGDEVAQLDPPVGDLGDRPSEDQAARGRAEHRADRPAVALQRDARAAPADAVEPGVGVADDHQADRVLERGLGRRLGQ